MIKNKKGQAAMEFLMTYGWAIVVVLVAIGGLAYFGVLNPSRFLPSSCTIMPGLSCDDFKIDADSITLVLRNGLGGTITVTSIIVEGCTDSLTGTIKNGGLQFFIFTGCDNTGRISKTIDLTYTAESGLSHHVVGRIIGRVEGPAGSSSSDPNICQNAESAGLCAGLDIAYGEGYRAACCSEHVLCCS